MNDMKKWLNLFESADALDEPIVEGSCPNKAIQYVPRGFGYKEVASPCGSTGIHGATIFCDECEERREQEYPQGWQNHPGDTCIHGTYLGSHEDNDERMCPQCELGESADPMTVLEGTDPLEAADELEEILEEMKDSIRQAERIMRGVGRIHYERAKAYWIGHIKASLDSNEFDFGGHEQDMAKTIQALRKSRDESGS